MGFLKNLNKWLSDIFLWVGGIALVLMTGISCINMGLRMLGAPIAGIYDLVCFLGALVAALPLAYTQLNKGHIAVDIVSSLLPKTLRSVGIGISYVLGMIFFSVAAWKVAMLGHIFRESGELAETLRIPFWPFTYAVAVSCGLMVFCLLVDLLCMFEPAPGGDK